jgi:hypothetical protein
VFPHPFAQRFCFRDFRLFLVRRLVWANECIHTYGDRLIPDPYTGSPKPVGVATRRRFPLFEGIGESSTGTLMMSIPFLSLAFIFPPCFFLSQGQIAPKGLAYWRACSVHQAIPESPGAKTASISRLDECKESGPG